MSQELILNQRIVLASRPQGAPVPENFRLEREALPDLQDGQIQLRTLYLSLDPYMRGRMSDAPSYAAPVEIGAVMEGGAVSVVEQSRNPAFKVGDLVVGQTGWQTHSISDGSAQGFAQPVDGGWGAGHAGHHGLHGADAHRPAQGR
jgi:NADPH-dependent curcumin reductase CurA